MKFSLVVGYHIAITCWEPQLRLFPSRRGRRHLQNPFFRLRRKLPSDLETNLREKSFSYSCSPCKILSDRHLCQSSPTSLRAVDDVENGIRFSVIDVDFCKLNIFNSIKYAFLVTLGSTIEKYRILVIFVDDVENHHSRQRRFSSICNFLVWQCTFYFSTDSDST